VISAFDPDALDICYLNETQTSNYPSMEGFDRAGAVNDLGNQCLDKSNCEQIFSIGQYYNQSPSYEIG